MSSANKRIIKTMSLIKVPELVFPYKNISKSSKSKDTKMGEITFPCLTPTAYSKKSENLLQCFTHDLT